MFNPIKTYKWHTLYIRVNQEKKVHKLLTEANIECYLPLKKTLRQRSDRKVWIEEPFFRSYLFVNISEFEYFKVLNAPGVIMYVTFEGKAHVMTNSQMTNIKTLINQQEREVVVSRETIEKGEKAKVLYGPFKGMEGEVIKICNSYRILLRIDSFGFNLYANISKDEIIIVEEPVNSPNDKKKKIVVY